MSVEFTIDEHIARVTINRPERRNAVDAETTEKLELIWEQIENDPNIRVVILTGAGDKAFCAGADLKAAASEKTGLEYWADARSNGFGGLSLRKTLHVPVIARVNGVAAGGGFEMVLGCDIVIAADHARFGLPEPKVGRMPLDGGMILLPRVMPEKAAMAMLLTGKFVSAAELQQYGVVNEVVPTEQLDAIVDSYADQIVECAPLSVKAIKESVKETIDLPIAEAFAKRLPGLMAALGSDDADEGPRAFQEKRKPVWKGR